MRLFDFKVRHVPEKKHTAADGLSKKGATAKELEELEEEDIDSFIDGQLNSLQTFTLSLPSPATFLFARIVAITCSKAKAETLETAKN